MLGLAGLLVMGAAPGKAASYTLNFTATVTGATDTFAADGVSAGDIASGSITYNPFNTGLYTFSAGSTFFNQASTALTFHVNHPAGFDFAHSASGIGGISSTDDGSTTGLNYQAFGQHESMKLFFLTNGATGTPLFSLASLPTNPIALLAFLSDTPFEADGFYHLSGMGQISFSISLSPAVTATPIPAALPLFGSGVAVLGFFARKRRKDLRTAA